MINFQDMVSLMELLNCLHKMEKRITVLEEDVMKLKHPTQTVGPLAGNTDFSYADQNPLTNGQAAGFVKYDTTGCAPVPLGTTFSTSTHKQSLDCKFAGPAPSLSELIGNQAGKFGGNNEQSASGQFPTPPSGPSDYERYAADVYNQCQTPKQFWYVDDDRQPHIDRRVQSNSIVAERRRLKPYAYRLPYGT